MLAETVMF